MIEEEGLGFRIDLDPQLPLLRPAITDYGEGSLPLLPSLPIALRPCLPAEGIVVVELLIVLAHEVAPRNVAIRVSRYELSLTRTLLLRYSHVLQVTVDPHRHLLALPLFLPVDLLEFEYRPVLDQKWMVECLPCRNPLLRLLLQQLTQQINAVSCDLLVFLRFVVQLALLVLVEDCVPALTREGLFTH